MIPVIALVGRPNVGKSTLFNRLTRSRDALVANYSGLTRDRKYGDGEMFDRRFMVIDTGGISGEEEGIDAEMAYQSLLAMSGQPATSSGARAVIKGCVRARARLCARQCGCVRVCLCLCAHGCARMRRCL